MHALATVLPGVCRQQFMLANSVAMRVLASNHASNIAVIYVQEL
jgi:hypothetical protein